jgi:predicted CXXCH cytochrome family protein
VQIQHSAQGLVLKASARNSSFRNVDAKSAGAGWSAAMRYADQVKWQMAICAASVATACRNPATVAVGVASVPQTKSNMLRSDYVGSAACKPCHAGVFDKWLTSPMHKMTRDPAEAEIRAPFAGETFAFKDDRADLFRAGDGRFMRLHSAKQPDRLFRVTRVIGNHYREDFAGVEVASTDDRVARGSGNEQILPVTYYFESHGYRPKGYSVMTHERPGLFAGGVWNQTCIFCHNTVPGLDSLLGALAGPSPPAYQGVTVDHLLPPDRRFVYRVTREDAFRAAVAGEVGALGASIAEASSPANVARSAVHAMADRFHGENLVEEGIGCEACHGGSREHAADPRVRTSYLPRADFLSVEAADGSAPTRALLINRTCARCHQVLFSRYPFTWEGKLRHKGTPGGSITTSGEARDFLLGGPARNLPCTGCHDPHAPDQPEHLAALATPAGNSVCVPCHTSLAIPESLAEHSHHKPDGPAGACIACHMPRKNMALTYSLTRYHRIGSPTDRERVERARGHARTGPTARASRGGHGACRTQSEVGRAEDCAALAQCLSARPTIRRPGTDILARRAVRGRRRCGPREHSAYARKMRSSSFGAGHHSPPPTQDGRAKRRRLRLPRVPGLRTGSPGRATTLRKR